MLRWLVNNLGLIVLALTMALILWVISAIQSDPIAEAQIQYRVLVQGEERLSDFVVTSNIPSLIETTVRAPRSKLAELQATNPKIVIDLVDLGPGQHIFRVQPTLAIQPGSIVSTQVATATVSIERLMQGKVPIKLSTSGVPAVGFRVGGTKLETDQATIIATQSVLSRVAAINAVIQVDGLRASVDVNAQRLVPVDAVGAVVRDVKITPDTVQARVSVEQLSNYRDLPVVVKWRGQPAEGYSVVDITVDPLIVTVFGQADAVQGTKGFIDTLDVVIDNKQEDVDERVGVNVPPGVSLVNATQTVRVRMLIRPQIGSRTVKRKPTILGLSSALSATVQPGQVDIVLSGPLPRLTKLTEDDVRATIDVVGLDEGRYELTPQLVAPDAVVATSLLPKTVQVDLVRPKKKP